VKQAWKYAGMHFCLFPNLPVTTSLILLVLECFYIKVKILLQQDKLIVANHIAKGQALFHWKVQFPLYTRKGI